MRPLLTGPLSVEHLTVDIVGLPDSLQGCTIVQLSDLHFDGLRLSQSLLTEAIARSNQLQPDIVVLTGDLVTDDPSPIGELAQLLRQFESRVGTYAVLGNHDVSMPGGKEQVTEALTNVGIHVLWNQIAYPFGDALPIVGLADFWSREFNPAPVLNSLSADQPRIVLSHNPDSAAHLMSWRVDLQLSGHTHGGQVVIPGLGPLPTWYQAVRRWVPKPLRRWVPYMREDCYRVVRHWEWAMSLHQVGNNMLYVNRGLGTYFPGRVFCPPELTVVTLMAKPLPKMTIERPLEAVL